MSLRPAKRCDKEQVLECLEAMRRPDVALPQACIREHPRFVVRGDAHLLPMSRTGLQDEPTEAHLRDVSFGGVGMVVSRPMCVGSHWRLIFQCKGYPIGEMGVVVRHCRAVGENAHLIGAGFVAVPGLLSQLGVPTSDIERCMHAHCDAMRCAGSDDSYLPPGEVA